jgi:hypothetical protein
VAFAIAATVAFPAVLLKSAISRTTKLLSQRFADGRESVAGM